MGIGGGGGGGGGMGGFMTGRATANLLTRTTAVLAALFMVLSLTIAWYNQPVAQSGSIQIRPRPSANRHRKGRRTRPRFRPRQWRNRWRSNQGFRDFRSRGWQNLFKGRRAFAASFILHGLKLGYIGVPWRGTSSSPAAWFPHSAKVLHRRRLARCCRRAATRVRLRKLDPYLNVDPGTMSPYQHGEVFVTDDGAETDLDLGHYERFTGVPARQADNVTTGRIYPGDHRQGAARRLSRRHRPGHSARHRRDQGLRRSRQSRTSISCCARSAARSATSRACRSSRPSASSATNCRADERHVHPSDAGALSSRAAGELKTKPTQHSVKELRSIGIQPDILLCRADRAIPRGRAAQDRAVLQRARPSRHPGARRRHHLRRADRLSRGGPRRRSAGGTSASPMRRSRTSTRWQANRRPRRQSRRRSAPSPSSANTPA